MFKPRNNLRHHIINWVLNWTPKEKWNGDPMCDAFTLVTECQKLQPYVNVMYHLISRRPRVRDRDIAFELSLKESVPILAKRIREWVLSNPHIHGSAPKINPNTGEIVYGSKIRLGYLDTTGSPRTSSHFAAPWIHQQYRYWLHADGMKEARIAEVFAFISSWGHPANQIAQKGKSKEDLYAFVISPQD